MPSRGRQGGVRRFVTLSRRGGDILDDRGGSATVKISGKTGGGDGIEATIECNGVLDIGS